MFSSSKGSRPSLPRPPSRKAQDMVRQVAALLTSEEKADDVTILRTGEVYVGNEASRRPASLEVEPKMLPEIAQALHAVDSTQAESAFQVVSEGVLWSVVRPPLVDVESIRGVRAPRRRRELGEYVEDGLMANEIASALVMGVRSGAGVLIVAKDLSAGAQLLDTLLPLTSPGQSAFYLGDTRLLDPEELSLNGINIEMLQQMPEEEQFPVLLALQSARWVFAERLVTKGDVKFWLGGGTSGRGRVGVIAGRSAEAGVATLNSLVKAASGAEVDVADFIEHVVLVHHLRPGRADAIELVAIADVQAKAEPAPAPSGVFKKARRGSTRTGPQEIQPQPYDNAATSRPGSGLEHKAIQPVSELPVTSDNPAQQAVSAAPVEVQAPTPVPPQAPVPASAGPSSTYNPKASAPAARSISNPHLPTASQASPQNPSGTSQRPTSSAATPRPERRPAPQMPATQVARASSPHLAPIAPAATPTPTPAPAPAPVVGFDDVEADFSLNSSDEASLGNAVSSAFEDFGDDMFDLSDDPVAAELPPPAAAPTADAGGQDFSFFGPGELDDVLDDQPAPTRDRQSGPRLATSSRYNADLAANDAESIRQTQYRRTASQAEIPRPSGPVVGRGARTRRPGSGQNPLLAEQAPATADFSVVTSGSSPQLPAFDGNAFMQEGTLDDAVEGEFADEPTRRAEWKDTAKMLSNINRKK